MRDFLKTFGPGILFASTCIGVSHLVQSTRAGADYGLILLVAILLANVFKYPFFEFASRYTNATGKSMLDGFLEVGRWTLLVYLMITLLSMFVVTAAVTFVTAGLLGNLLPGITLATEYWAAIVFSVCIGILVLGKYRVLDSLLKIVAAVLVISTLVAVASAMHHGRVAPEAPLIPEGLLEGRGIIFIIALMGWMPTAVDMSVWTSLWTEERIRQTGYHPKLRETLLDFNIGYLVSAFLAVFFLLLGALLLYGTDVALQDSALGFSKQLIGLYTETIGDWSYWVIALAAFTTMFSTSITVMDGYGRTLSRIVRLLSGKEGSDTRLSHGVSILLVATGGFVVISQFGDKLKALVDMATILSFVIAPLAAWLNYKVIYSGKLQEVFLPPPWLKRLALAGLIFLGFFTLVYFYILIFDVV
jgi:Mn2+/Fe2+ NRAMP family transporter